MLDRGDPKSPELKLEREFLRVYIMVSIAKTIAENSTSEGKEAVKMKYGQ